MVWQKTEKKCEGDIEKIKLMLERVEKLKKLSDEKMKVPSEKGNSEDKEKERINAMLTLDDKINGIKKKLDEIEKQKSYAASGDEIMAIKTIKQKKSAKEAIQTASAEEKEIKKSESENGAEVETSERKRSYKESNLSDSDINSLKKSINSLNSAVESLIKLFSEANKTLYNDTDKVINSKLDNIIEQNNKIADKNERLTEAMLSMAEMLNQSIPNIMHHKQNNIEKLSFSGAKKMQADDEMSGNMTEKISHKEIRQIFSNDRNEEMKEIKNKMEDAMAGKISGGKKTQEVEPNLSEALEKEINNEDRDLKPIKKKPLKLNIAPRPPSFFGGDDSPSNTLSSFG